MCTGKTTLQNLSLCLQQLPKSATHSTLQHPQLTQNAQNGIQYNPRNIHTYGSFIFFKQFPSVTKLLKGHETSLKRVFSTPKNCMWTPYCFQNRFRTACLDNPFRISVCFLDSFYGPSVISFLVFTIDFNLLFLPPRLILFSCLLPPNWNRKCVGFCPKERESFSPVFLVFFHSS